jgi:hypothetical protein
MTADKDSDWREWENWKVTDSRTGSALGMSSYPTKESCEKAIEGFIARDKRGGRPDIHEIIPFMVAVRFVPGSYSKHYTPTEDTK